MFNIVLSSTGWQTWFKNIWPNFLNLSNAASLTDKYGLPSVLDCLDVCHRLRTDHWTYESLKKMSRSFNFWWNERKRLALKLTLKKARDACPKRVWGREVRKSLIRHLTRQQALTIKLAKAAPQTDFKHSPSCAHQFKSDQIFTVIKITHRHSSRSGPDQSGRGLCGSQDYYY